MRTSLRWLSLAALVLSPAAFAGPTTSLAVAPPVDQGGDLRGVTLEVGGGAEGYIGPLANKIRVGPSWGANVVLKPTTVLGIEVGYSGSVDRFDPTTLIGSAHTSHSSVLRNGGQALLSVGLSDTRCQPYLMAGVGINRYTILGGATDSGYRSASDLTLPVGIGLRTVFVGKFTLDIRVNYTLSFGNDFASGVSGASGNATRDLARLSAGAFFGYTF